jgi:hypothetical protein
MPQFRGVNGSRTVLRRYSEDDPCKTLKVTDIAPEDTADYPRDLFSGHVALSIGLEKAIREREQASHCPPLTAID